MSFVFQSDTLFCEEVALAEIAGRAGTPVYVYSASAIRDRYRAWESAFGPRPHTVCYAVKANASLALLALLAREGAGFDIVSGGELYRVLEAGGDPAKVVFSGVGKTREEIDYALARGIFSFNCESEPELALIDSLASRRGVRARVALRVNPDVDAATHPYISTGLREHKFGVDIAQAEGVYQRALSLRNLLPESLSCHIGSQLLDPRPMRDAVERVLHLAQKLRARGIPIRHLDLGGGLGVPYEPGTAAPRIADWVREALAPLAGEDYHVLVEPGRSIVAEAGVLLTRVLYRKKNGEKEFVIVDAGMNDLLRPALYQAYHEILPLRRNGLPPVQADVVGPVCESADFLARSRHIANVLPGDFLAVANAGAYGFVCASNYNARTRAAEVLVEGARWRVIRERETYEDLIRGETI
jgi:diaminopimelate decarboxylase